MKNTFGNNISVTISGESHGEAITVILDGIKSGVKIDETLISDALSLRAPSESYSTSRIEKDDFSILCGIFEGYTTGTPITFTIPNKSYNSKEYNPDIIRPGHADYSNFCKYGEHYDYRGGGHSSGRVTVGITVAGEICRQILENKGIRIVSRIKRCGGIDDVCDYKGDVFSVLFNKKFPVFDDDKASLMIESINKAKSSGDSVGGITETYVYGVPAGLGEPFFDSLESMISHGVFSIPGIKGIEFGEGFASADKLGSEVNDSFIIDDGKIKTLTNNNGGINGGISNGMPIIFRCAFKPTPSISKPQQTVNLSTKENIEYQINGRHDACIVPRGVHVVTSMTNIVIYDMLCERFGRMLEGI